MNMQNQMIDNIKKYGLLHFALLIYTSSSMLSKQGSSYSIGTLYFLVIYGLVLFLLFFYAILWQQVLKRIPLNISYANKSITIVWGMVLGAILFGEVISFKMIIGSVLIISGICLVVKNNE